MQSLEEIQDTVTRSEAVQDAVWNEAAIMPDRPSAILAGFMQSLSALTDLQMKRLRAAVWNRIPPTIVLMLYVIAFLAVSTMGYGAGLAANRTMIPAVVLILAFSAIIVLIVDLEGPLQQLFKVSQEPMIDVARRMQLPRP